MATVSHWETTALPKFSDSRTDIQTDVVVVGGGMTGISTAYLLKQAGQRVILVERDRCAHHDTAHTTAHLTYVTDRRLHRLVDELGVDHAEAVWDAGQAAIEKISEIIESEAIECEFGWSPGYLHAALNSERDETAELQQDADLAQKMGFGATFVSSVPVFNRPGVRFANQARFHPLIPTCLDG